jgi:hypothetical protein
MSRKENPHWGTTLDEFLAEEGLREAARAGARTRIVRQLSQANPRAKSRMRRGIVDAMHALHKAGAVSADELEKTTRRMLSATPGGPDKATAARPEGKRQTSSRCSRRGQKGEDQRAS